MCILQSGWLDFILLKSGAETPKRGHTGNPGLGIYERGRRLQRRFRVVGARAQYRYSDPRADTFPSNAMQHHLVNALSE